MLEFGPLDVEIGDDYVLWPTPRDFYLARRAIRTTSSWTVAEYDATNDPYPAGINEAPRAIAAAAMGDDNAMDIDVAMNDAAMNDATINEAEVDSVPTIDQAIQGSFLLFIRNHLVPFCFCLGRVLFDFSC